jgi:hypothetical protein
LYHPLRQRALYLLLAHQLQLQPHRSLVFEARQARVEVELRGVLVPAQLAEASAQLESQRNKPDLQIGREVRLEAPTNDLPAQIRPQRLRQELSQKTKPLERLEALSDDSKPASPCRQCHHFHCNSECI